MKVSSTFLAKKGPSNLYVELRSSLLTHKHFAQLVGLVGLVSWLASCPRQVKVEVKAEGAKGWRLEARG